jgi:hypothetical protein
MTLPSTHAISLTRPAMLRPDGYVALDLIVDGVPVTGIVHRSRAAGAPGAPSHDLEAAALHFTATYVEAHPLMFHRLFTHGVPSRGKVCSRWIEKHSAGTWLAFKVIADDVLCEVSISPALHTLSFRPAPPAPTMDEESLFMLWASAYDVCLAYMTEHVEDIRSLGFDASELLRDFEACMNENL